MSSKPNYLKTAVMLYAVAVHCLTIVLVMRELLSKDPILSFLLGGILAFMLAGHGFDYFCRKVLSYRVSIAMKIFLVIVARGFLAPRPLLDGILCSTLVLNLGIYEDYPLNLIVGLSAVAAVSLASLPVPAWTGFPFVALLNAALAVTAGLMTRYRESLIDTQEYSQRIEDALLQLNRATREYQESLLRIGAESAETERRRITNDIHDIVGYALTNNIVLMEAATDMMRSDPLGVTRMIAMARTNAEDGLQEIRRILYKYRGSRDFFPQGLQAIGRVVGIFRTSTGIPVRLEYGNLPWSFGHEVDHALLHLIQESMINALRHGGATAIRILLHVDGELLHAEIWDNGSGSDDVKEGIGLSGMRERIEKLGGTVRIGNMRDGFAVRAVVPAAATERMENQ